MSRYRPYLHETGLSIDILYYDTYETIATTFVESAVYYKSVGACLFILDANYGSD